jgi:hypothetical protein
MCSPYHADSENQYQIDPENVLTFVISSQYGIAMNAAVQTTVKPAVLMNQYPYYDSAGNRGQLIKLLFICGHTEQFMSLDLGRRAGYKWKPRTNRQLVDDHLRITCPIAWKLCRACSEAGAA